MSITIQSAVQSGSLVYTTSMNVTQAWMSYKHESHTGENVTQVWTSHKHEHHSTICSALRFSSVVILPNWHHAQAACSSSLLITLSLSLPLHRNLTDTGQVQNENKSIKTWSGKHEAMVNVVVTFIKRRTNSHIHRKCCHITYGF